MRDVEELEIEKWHCIMCGAKNKMIITYNYRGERNVGYTMRCCNCGKETIHLKPDRFINKKFLEFNSRKCIKPNECKHTTCPLHPQYTGNCNYGLSNASQIKNPLYSKLTFNVDEPKYL